MPLDGEAMVRRGSSEREQIYMRQLPGGGFVAIEVRPVRSFLGQRRYHGDLVVERRTTPERRQGHEAPAIAHAEGTTIASVFHHLFPLAQSNTAVAAECVRHMRGRAASG